MTKFNEFGLAEPLLKAVTESGYTTPTPIQIQAIPPVMDGKDVLGIAQTGTGKTAAFALPILHRLAADRRPTPRRGTRTLVLSPTRELATQIADSFRTYGKHLGFSVTVVFGGVSERPQIERLSRGVDILVATPGRLLDHLSQKNLTLDMAEIFVLDEADQMLDLGFFKPIRRIVSYLPKVRQNLFFSATMPKEIEELTRELLHNPVKVAVAPQSTTVERVAQRVILIEQNKKKALLTDLLADKAMQRTLVFTRTKRGADRVAKHLVSCGVDASAIHGNKSQNQRELALANFRDGKCRVLVATDIAARGIDIDEVTHVVNYELPEVPEAYVHRIGRTARAGASGAAYSFCDGGERHLLRDIERVTRQTLESIDRRNDANLASDRPGNDHSHTPRGASQRSGSGRPSQDRGGRGEGRPARGRSHGGADRRPERSERSPSEGRFAGRQDRPQRADAPRHDRGSSGPRRDREDSGRDEVWTNRGDSPDRQHREHRADRTPRDDRAPAPARFGHTGRESAREGSDRRNDRPPHRSGERPAFNAERANKDRGEPRHGAKPHDERPHHARPSGEHRGAGPRAEPRAEHRESHRGEGHRPHQARDERGSEGHRGGRPEGRGRPSHSQAGDSRNDRGGDRSGSGNPNPRPRPSHGRPTAPGYRGRDESRARTDRTD